MHETTAGEGDGNLTQTHAGIDAFSISVAYSSIAHMSLVTLASIYTLPERSEFIRWRQSSLC